MVLFCYFKVSLVSVCSHGQWRLMWWCFYSVSLALGEANKKSKAWAGCPGFQGLVISSHCFLLRDLEARAQNEFFRAFFRLPRKEKLHEVVDCSLWTPFSRCHTAGRMYTSDSYICFASKENGCCNVIIPLREVELFVSFQVLICLFLLQASTVIWLACKLLFDDEE